MNEDSAPSVSRLQEMGGGKMTSRTIEDLTYTLEDMGTLPSPLLVCYVETNSLLLVCHNKTRQVMSETGTSRRASLQGK